MASCSSASRYACASTLKSGSDGGALNPDQLAAAIMAAAWGRRVDTYSNVMVGPES
jgi:hypothetical protein